MNKLIDWIEEKLDLGCALEFLTESDVRLSIRIANLITKDWIRETYIGIKYNAERIINSPSESKEMVYSKRIAKRIIDELKIEKEN